MMNIVRFSCNCGESLEIETTTDGIELVHKFGWAVTYNCSDETSKFYCPSCVASRKAKSDYFSYHHTSERHCNLRCWCGFQPKALPKWCEHKAVFALKGTVYRIVSVGSTNRRTNGKHFEDYVISEPISEEWKFPDCPTTKKDIAKALGELYSLPTFYSEDLVTAIHVVK